MLIAQVCPCSQFKKKKKVAKVRKKMADGE